MRLTRDEIYPYKGFHNCDCVCRIRVYEEPNRPYVVIATQLPENRGTSITNFAEHLAAQISLQLEYPERGMRWIEHYPAESRRLIREESFTEVRFLFDPPLKGMKDPRWQSLAHLKQETVVIDTGDPDIGTVVVVGYPHPRGFKGPEWRDMTREEVEALVGQPV